MRRSYYNDGKLALCLFVALPKLAYVYVRSSPSSLNTHCHIISPIIVAISGFKDPLSKQKGQCGICFSKWKQEVWFFSLQCILCAACIFIHLAVLEYHNRIWRRIYFSTPSIGENSIRISKASYITWTMRNIDIVVSIRSVYFLQTAKKINQVKIDFSLIR